MILKKDYRFNTKSIKHKWISCNQCSIVDMCVGGGLLLQHVITHGGLKQQDVFSHISGA